MSCATCIKQLHKFVVARVARNKILVAKKIYKTQNFTSDNMLNKYINCPNQYESLSPIELNSFFNTKNKTFQNIVTQNY
jgi:hypothetical protein